MRFQCKIYGKHAHTSSQRLQPHDDGPARRHLGDQRLRGSSCLDRSYGDARSHVPYDAYGGHFTFLIKKIVQTKFIFPVSATCTKVAVELVILAYVFLFPLLHK